MKRKVVAALLAMMSLTTGISSVAAASGMFTDVKPNSKYELSIEKVADEGLMDKVKDDEFGVDEEVSRVDFVEALYRLAGKPEVTGKATLQGNDTDALIWAEQVGLFEGLEKGVFTDNEFDSEESFTREEVVVMLYNFAKNVDKLDMDFEAVAMNFEDKATEEYTDAIDWAAANGIISKEDAESKKDGNFFKYQTSITRGMVAEWLARYMDMVDALEENTGVATAETVKDATSVVVKNNKTTTSTATSNGTSTSVKVTDTVDKKEDTKGEVKDDATAGTEEEDKHEHCLVDNMVSVTHPEEGHYEKELVKEAWTEKVEHEAEYKDVYVKDADAVYNTVHHDAITHEEEVYVKDADAVYNTVHHDAITHEEEVYVKDADAVYNTVHHDAEGYYKDVKVVDTAAWTETVNHPEEGHWGEVDVVDKEAWDEDVYDYKLVCNNCGKILSGMSQEEVIAEQKAHRLNGESSGYGTHYVKVDTIHHPAETHTESKWIVDKQAWVETINHPEVSHTEQQWVETKAAWDEKVLVTEEKGHYETVTVTDKEAWDEQVLVTEEKGHYETVTVTDKEAWDEQVLVTPEQGHYEKELVKDAWTETVEHEAEYEDVWVVDVAEWVENVKDGMICTDCGTVIR